MNYLMHVFEKMPNIDIKNDIDAIQNLFPWFKQPEYCYIKKND